MGSPTTFTQDFLTEYLEAGETEVSFGVAGLYLLRLRK